VSTSHRIMLARRAAGLSQSALAERVRVNRSAVSHWECGRSKAPSVARLGDISRATSVSFEWLATGSGAMRPDADPPAPRATPGSDCIQGPLETRLICAFRGAADGLRLAVVEVLEASR